MQTSPRKKRSSTRPEKSRGKTTGRAQGANRQQKKLWQVVADTVIQGIEEGKYAEGSRLPPEAGIAEEIGVNRHTVRRAVAELVKSGRLRPNPRGGTVVAPIRASLTLNSSERFSDTLEQAGFATHGQLLSSKLADKPIPSEIARELQCPAMASLISLRYLQVANGLPLTLVTTWADADRFKRLPDVYSHTGHLERAFSQLGISGFRRHKAIVSCRTATADEVDRLELQAGAFVLVLKILYVGEDGEPLCFSECSFPANRLQLVFFI